MMTKEAAVAKAKLSLSQIANEAGYLQPEQSRRLIQLSIPETSVLSEATIVPMKAQQRHIEKMRFASRVLRAASADTTFEDIEKASPQFSKQVLDSRLFRAQVDVPLEVLEDNIEGPQLMMSILQALAPRIGLDMEEVGLNGDTTNTVDPFLASFNGILNQATSYQYDHQGDVPNLELWHRTIKLMPPEFQKMMGGMKLYTSFNTKLDWRVSVAGRNTPQGDAALAGTNMIGALGIPLVSVANFREDMTYNAVSNHARVLLTHPQNIVVGLHAGIQMFYDFNIERGVWIIVLRLRFDWKLVEKTAAVRANNVLLGPSSVRVGGTSTALLTQDSPTPNSRLGFTVTDSAIGNDDGLSTFLPPTGAGLGVTAPALYP